MGSMDVSKAGRKSMDVAGIRRWKRRGYYSERVLVRLLKQHGYRAVRIPVSAPSSEPLPDIFATRDGHIYAFEVKNAKFYAYFPAAQVRKLFEFLDLFDLYGRLEKLTNEPRRLRHAILAAHLGKKWVFKEVTRREVEHLPPDSRICVNKRMRGNWRP